jgi:hypothetical protein
MIKIRTSKNIIQAQIKLNDELGDVGKRNPEDHHPTWSTYGRISNIKQWAKSLTVRPLLDTGM